MLPSRLFWIVLALLSVACAAVAYLYFPVAFPLVTLDLRMDRQTALAEARASAERHRWDPSPYRQAASFGLDDRLQTYVELEAGGTEAFRKMLAQGPYSPYTWQVRHFKEGQTLETWVRFTPAGQPYGFLQKLPEDEPGPTVSRDRAQTIAEDTATDAWQIDLSRYELIETSQEVRPGGRTDHTFVYRRRHDRVGEAEYRLRLVVGGDQLTEITHFVKVPEAFSRRYEEMRSANDTIATVSGVATVVLYIMGGCVVGLFFLLRHRWAIPRPALVWGFFISFLQVLVALNQWPLMWMSYDTALSVASFVLRQAVVLLAGWLGMGVVFSLTFMAAEGLTRRAFGDQIRFWKLWSPSVAGTPSVAGLTVAGYLLVAVLFAYEVGLYFLSARWLGWWTPSSALFDPDVLAAYFPWLSAIAISLQAGFWEECLFRAVPIAGAALIGERVGRRQAWTIGAFVLQALIFGAGHANYPAQPAYARVAELIIPSLLFGWVYLRFGLLTAIVLHFAFDVTWFALPLFVSTAPGIWVDRLMVILLTLVPIWVVLGARWRNGRWESLGHDALNRTWQPPAPAPREVQAREGQDRPVLPRMTPRILPVVGVACLAAWFVVLNIHTEAPPFQIGRDDALGEARREIAARGIVLPESWRALAGVHGAVDLGDRFIWQKGGESAYQQLFGSYLPPPHWRIRFVRFEGDVADRAEEYQVYIGPDGDTFRFRHRLPESRPGARWSEVKARERAYPVLRSVYTLNRNQVEEISAVPSKHPHRKDWVLTFADREHYPMEEGEARVAVEIAGDEVADVYRWVHVPEEWQRQERERRTRAQIGTVVCWVVLATCLIGGVAGGIIAWSHRRFDRGSFLTSFVVLGGIGVIDFINTWPSLASDFSTAQPLGLQTLTTIGLGIVSLLVASAAPAILIGYAHAAKPSGSSVGRPHRILLGLSLGAVAAGAVALVQNATFPSLPKWPDYTFLGTYLPLYSAVFSPFVSFVRSAAFVLLVFTIVDRASNGWTQHKALLTTGLLVLGLAVGGPGPQGNGAAWIATGFTLGLALVAGYIVVLRYDLALVLPAVGVVQALDVLERGLQQAFTAAVPGALLAAILIISSSILWSGKLQPSRPGPLIAGRESG